MQIGDHVTVEHEGHTGTGIIDKVVGDRVYVRLTVRPAQAWTSPLTGGTVPAGGPISYLLWLPVADVHPARLALASPLDPSAG